MGILEELSRAKGWYGCSGRVEVGLSSQLSTWLQFSNKVMFWAVRKRNRGKSAGILGCYVKWRNVKGLFKKKLISC